MITEQLMIWTSSANILCKYNLIIDWLKASIYEKTLKLLKKKSTDLDLSLISSFRRGNEVPNICAINRTILAVYNLKIL